MTIWRVRIACRIPKATNTHPEYVILLDSHCNKAAQMRLNVYTVRTLPVLLRNQ